MAVWGSNQRWRSIGADKVVYPHSILNSRVSSYKIEDLFHSIKGFRKRTSFESLSEQQKNDSECSVQNGSISVIFQTSVLVTFFSFQLSFHLLTDKIFNKLLGGENLKVNCLRQMLFFCLRRLLL